MNELFLVMSSGFLLLYMSIPTESPFSNLIYNWHNVQSLSNLLNPYMVFQTNPLDPMEHSHLGLI